MCSCPSCAGSNDPPKRPMTIPLVAMGKPCRIGAGVARKRWHLEPEIVAFDAETLGETGIVVQSTDAQGARPEAQSRPMGVVSYCAPSTVTWTSRSQRSNPCTTARGIGRCAARTFGQGHDRLFWCQLSCRTRSRRIKIRTADRTVAGVH